VDDTKLLEKFILKEISDNMATVINSKHGLTLLSALIVPDEKNKNDLDVVYGITLKNTQRYPFYISKKDVP
jgi:hypothetical protein